MTETRAFCPRCGDPVEHSGEGRRDAALCDACYVERYDLVDAPDRVEVLVCATCGAVQRGERWEDVGAEDYTDVAVDAVTEALAVHVEAADFRWEVQPEQVDPTTVRMHCHVTGRLRGTPLEESVTVPVKISRGTCTRCGRIAGDAYASVVQVRAAGERTPAPEETERARDIATEMVTEMEADGDRSAFVTDVSAVEEGLDIKLSTNKLGKRVGNKLVEEFGGTVSDSETLVTEDEDGEEVYRVTYAVRLPPFRPGDVVDPADGEGPVLVRSVRGALKGVRLASGADYEATDGLADARRLGERGDAVETTLVAVEDERAVQVLDPETYETKTVARPDYLDPDADSVPVLRHREGLHVLPEDGAER